VDISTRRQPFGGWRCEDHDGLHWRKTRSNCSGPQQYHISTLLSDRRRSNVRFSSLVDNSSRVTSGHPHGQAEHPCNWCLASALQAHELQETTGSATVGEPAVKEQDDTSGTLVMQTCAKIIQQMTDFQPLQQLQLSRYVQSSLSLQVLRPAAS
jgi:hypothetical protein